MNNKGFTLIELLVVVLLIGILSSVALPSYTKSIEKARLSEALVNAKAILDSSHRYLEMEPSQVGQSFNKTKISDVALNGGSWDNASTGTVYTTKMFVYTLGKLKDSESSCTGSGDATITVVRMQNGNQLYKFYVCGNNSKVFDGTATTAVQKNIKQLLETL